MSFQKKQFNKTKHDLEVYREIILLANSVLKWDNKIFPGIIFGGISFIFLVLWYLDLSVLTFVALSLLFVTFLDYAFPYVSKLIFKSNNWTGVQEKKFEQICYEIVHVKSKLCAGFHYAFAAKEEKSTVVSIYILSKFYNKNWVIKIKINAYKCVLHVYTPTC